MNYEIRRPRKSLDLYIDSIWVQEDLRNAAFENYHPTRVIPRGAIELLFHYRDPYVHIEEGRAEFEPKFYISGQKTRPIEVSATGQTGIIIVNFHPWGAAPFFGFSLDELTDTSLEMNLVMRTDTIENRVQEASGTAARVEIIQDFLAGVLDVDRRDELVMESVHKINRSQGNVSIGKIADDLQISRRQFLRRFSRNIGMSPKAFANVIRFQKASYYKRQGVDWSEITFRCGYYDQAHFINDVRRFSGLSAKNLSPKRPLTKLGHHFSSGRKASHFYNTTYL